MRIIQFGVVVFFDGLGCVFDGLGCVFDGRRMAVGGRLVFGGVFEFLFRGRWRFVLRFDFLDDGPEPVDVVGRVLDHARGTVRFDQAVRTFDAAVPVAHFVLAFHVAGRRVVYRVLEVVRLRRARFVMIAGVVLTDRVTVRRRRGRDQAR